ncbi:hypothetical protein LRP88_12324 [Fusarium phalaenopsidis]
MTTPVSPEPITSSPTPAPGTVSPPSYTPKPAEVAPNTDEKIAIPYVPVHTHPPDPPKSEYPVPPSTVSPAPGSIMNLHGDGTQSPPILQHPALAGQMAPGQMAPGQMGYAGHESMVVPIAIAAGLFFSTLFGVIFPYTCHCASHISHYCKNCGRKVAYKQRGGQMEPQGTPEHLREVSKYPAAEPKTKK